MLSFRRSENGVIMSGDKVRLLKVRLKVRLAEEEEEMEATRIRLIRKNPSPNYFVQKNDA